MQIGLILTSASTPLAVILILCVLAGIGVSAAHVLPWAIIPDAIEYDQLQTGTRHEGMFYSLITLANKIAQSIAIPLILVVLDLTGYQPNVAIQNQSAINGIRLVVGPIPAAMLLLGIVFAFTYPLDREKYNEVKAKIQEVQNIPTNGS